MASQALPEGPWTGIFGRFAPQEVRPGHSSGQGRFESIVSMAGGGHEDSGNTHPALSMAVRSPASTIACPKVGYTETGPSALGRRDRPSLGSPPLFLRRCRCRRTLREECPHMASLVKELIEAGIHFGQRRSNLESEDAPIHLRQPVIRST